MNLEQLIEQRSIFRLDVGGGDNPQGPDWVVMDIRPRKTVHIVWDCEETPWKHETEVLPSDLCSVVLMSHLWEHISPKRTLAVADEVWRVLKPDGQWWITAPYGWSYGYLQDPTHCNPVVEATFEYWDPRFPLYQVYKPKPFQIIERKWEMGGNIFAVMSAQKNGHSRE